MTVENRKQINAVDIDALLEQVQKPLRYTGGEMNAAPKEWKEGMLRFAFAFPDTYEVGMSHLGLKILQHIINEMPEALCERVFLPWVDMLALMKEQGVPLFTLESRLPVAAFDIVGFTLQYEMSYTNILEMLSLSGIPVLSGDRGEDDPIIIAGGPCAFNPEPLHAFIDAFAIGDGEEETPELIRAVVASRAAGENREQCLLRLSKLRGIYVPRFYRAEYLPDGRLASFTPTRDDVPVRVEKNVIDNLDAADFPDHIPVPYTDIVHDRIQLEVMRGCTKGCRFCQAGMLYRPVRERSPEILLSQAKQLVAATGYEELSLSSLSTGDYSCLPALTSQLMAELGDQRVSVSLPSLRIDSELEQTLGETQRVKKSSLTYAPEAGTQRMRDVINKGVTEAQLIEAARRAFTGGWSSIKLYFMMGLPTETEADLEGIADLAQKVVAEYYKVPKGQRAPGLRVTASVAVFVPKPFTPFQWVAQDTRELIEQKQRYLREKLRIKGVHFNWHDPSLSFLEACFARGDRRLADVLYKAWQKGCILDGWNEIFRLDLWMEAFAECGLSPDFYAHREREQDELLPWDFIDAGVTKAFLWREWQRAQAAEATPDCRAGCQGCGIQRWKGVCPIADAD